MGDGITTVPDLDDDAFPGEGIALVVDLHPADGCQQVQGGRGPLSGSPSRVPPRAFSSSTVKGMPWRTLGPCRATARVSGGISPMTIGSAADATGPSRRRHARRRMRVRALILS
jgi:hypothetical protein